VRWNYDVSHKIARLIEPVLEMDEAWQLFKKKCADARNSLLLTGYHMLAPPNQRSTARYQNADILIDWGSRLLIEPEQRFRSISQLSWLSDHRTHLARWSQFIEISREVRNEVRINGLSNSGYENLLTKLLPKDLTKAGELFAGQVCDFVFEQSRGIPSGASLIGSTEVIESLFGRFKHIMGSTHWAVTGFGRMILTLASRLGNLSTKLVNSALTSIRYNDLREWLQTCTIY